MRKTWIQSLGCRKLYQRALTVDMVGSISEVANSLAGNFRFTRQTHRRYTVAEHCVQGARLLMAESKTFSACAFLLHELSEVYLPDVAGPMKPFTFVEVTDSPIDFSEFGPVYSIGAPVGQGKLIAWSTLEKQHMRVMLETFGLSTLERAVYHPTVKAMDMAMLAAEKRDLCGPPPEDWPGLENVEPAPVLLVYPWSPERAAAEFLALYSELFS